MIWFYADEDDQQHETVDSALSDLVKSGVIQRDTLLWNETMSDWAEAGPIRPDLFQAASVPPELTQHQKRQIVAAGAAGPGVAPNQSDVDVTAICALVFGILGLFCFPIFSPVAVICGHIALKRANELGRQSASKGLAIAGLVTGYMGLLVIVIFVGLFLLGFLEGSAG